MDIRTLWRDIRFLKILAQLIFLIVLVSIAAYLYINVTTNLARQGLTMGYGFMKNPASFGIGESFIPYDPSNTYARALLVAVIGHGGAGKTQLIAALLYVAGATPRLGRVDDGTTVTDYDEEEIVHIDGKQFRRKLPKPSSPTESSRSAIALAASAHWTSREVLEARAEITRNAGRK